MLKQILSTAGVAASLVGAVAMTAPQASAAERTDATAHTQDDKGPKSDVPLVGKTLDQVPVLRGNGVHNNLGS